MALGAAERLRFTLGDVLDAVVVTPERRQEPQRWLVVGRREATIGGEPAVIVDYTFDPPERSLDGRGAGSCRWTGRIRPRAASCRRCG